MAPVVMCLVAFNLTGCSLLFTTGPAPNAARARHPPDCTTSDAAPIVDSAIAGFQVVRVAVAVGASDADYKDLPISRGADVGIGITLAALFALSAVDGFSTTSACVDARERWVRRHSRKARRKRTPTPERSPRSAPQSAPARTSEPTPPPAQVEPETPPPSSTQDPGSDGDEIQKGTPF